MEYECGVCKTTYDKKDEAQKCENKPVEIKLFKKGDRIKVGYEHTCNQKNKDFIPRGMVIEILGPEPMDEDYSHRCLGSKLFNWHAYQYVVEFKCLCGEIRQNAFFSPQIKKISR